MGRFSKPASCQDVTSCRGMRLSPAGAALLAAFTAITGGLFGLLALWLPHVRHALLYRSCPLEAAHYVHFQLRDGRFGVVRVEVAEQGAGAPPLRVATFQQARYVMAPPGGDDSAGGGLEGRGLAFTRVPKVAPEAAARLPAVAAALARDRAAAPPPFHRDVAARAAAAARYGPNLMVVPVPPLWQLLARSLLHPFCLFQYASCVIWCWQAYYSYSAIILFITLATFTATSVSDWRTARRMAGMALFSCPVQVLGPGDATTEVDSSALVPGDLVLVRRGRLPADMLLLSGEAVVDEAKLTGESVAVRKVPYCASSCRHLGASTAAAGAGGEFDGSEEAAQAGLGVAEDQPQAVLSGDTEVQVALAAPGAAAGAPVAVVLNSGFASAKGGMLRGMMHPTKHKLRFTNDALWFILMMMLIGMCFYVWSVVLLVRMGAKPSMIVLKYLDLITVAVPPALVACLAIATAAAVGRLWRRGISVSSSGHISLAGLVDTVAFDKTGTLTESGLELRGLRLAEGGAFSDHWALPTADGGARAAGGAPAAAETPAPGAAEAGGARNAAGAAAGAPREVQVLLAACHSLALVGGALAGDTLELKLFEASGWACMGEEPRAEPPAGAGAGGGAGGMVVASPRGERCLVVRRYDFTSARQRSSVVVAHGDGSLAVYSKGSPEVMRELCSHGVPADFDAQLQAATQAGFRTLALAWRPLAPGTPLDAALSAGAAATEAGLTFLGFALLDNPLKQDSLDAVLQLRRAQMQVLMASGDHIRTAVHVAQQCAILDRGRPVAVLSTRGAGGAEGGGALGLEAVMVDGSGAAAPAAVRDAVRAVAEGRAQCAVTGAALRALRRAAAAAAATQQAPDCKGEPSGAAGGGSPRTPDAGVEVFEIEVEPKDMPAPLTLESGTPPPGLGDGAVVMVEALQQSPVPAVTAVVATRPGAPADATVAGWLQVVLNSCAVYARMTPADKALLMELLGPGEQGAGEGAGLPGLGRTVAFCGDGANDTGALKASLVGLSLCQAEASIAAPLTSRDATAAAMVAVVSEGRCSLAAAYAIFRFVMSYALIQVFGICLVYMYGLVIGNYQYLIQDLFFATVLAAFMATTPPCRRLSAERPPPCLMSAAVIVPVAVHFITIGVFQVAALVMLGREPWHKRFDTEANGVLAASMAPENTVIFSMNVVQIWISCLALNIGRPFRAPIWANRPLVAVLVVQLGLVLYFVVAPVDYPGGRTDPILSKFVQLVEIPAPFKGKLLALMAANGVAAYLMQYAARAALRLAAALRAARRP